MINIIKERKEELGYTYEELARQADLPLDIVVDYLEGKIPALGYVSLRAIYQVLFPEEEVDKICEPEPAYKVHMVKRQGEYTVEDYLAWPEEQRIELIDGVIYDMAAPTDIHQILVGEVFGELRNYIRNNKGKCMYFISPIDVQLDRDDKTMLQPDVLVVCDREKFKDGRIYGAPDFVAEIVSPSTRKKDMIKKLNKYQMAGVKEYWILDPRDKIAIVYSNMTPGSKDTKIYPFDSQVPVGIYDGNCVVDFEEIDNFINFYFNNGRENAYD